MKYRKGPLKGSIERHDRQKVIVSEVGQELLQGQEHIDKLVAIIHGARDIQEYYEIDGLFLGGMGAVCSYSRQADADYRGSNKRFTNKVHFED
jgi:hypothetical protein